MPTSDSCCLRAARMKIHSSGNLRRSAETTKALAATAAVQPERWKIVLSNATACIRGHGAEKETPSPTSTKTVSGMPQRVICNDCAVADFVKKMQLENREPHRLVAFSMPGWRSMEAASTSGTRAAVRDEREGKSRFSGTTTICSYRSPFRIRGADGRCLLSKTAPETNRIHAASKLPRSPVSQRQIPNSFRRSIRVASAQSQF